MSLVVHLVPSLEDLGAGASLLIDGDEGHHAVVVRRLRVGERIVVTDGAGRAAEAVVAMTGKRDMTVTLDEVRTLAEPSPRFTIVQAIPKGDRGELAVEMLTEIGVARVVPWASARSLGAWKGERAAKQHARWAATAREAAKQSRRAWFPEVTSMMTTDQVRGLVREADVTVVLHEEATGPVAAVDLADAGSVLIVVGPEGGLTAEEVVAFEELGAHSVRLGTEVLRTSTAGVAAAAALLARTPRWA